MSNPKFIRWMEEHYALDGIDWKDDRQETIKKNLTEIAKKYPHPRGKSVERLQQFWGSYQDDFRKASAEGGGNKNLYEYIGENLSKKAEKEAERLTVYSGKWDTLPEKSVKDIQLDEAKPNLKKVVEDKVAEKFAEKTKAFIREKEKEIDEAKGATKQIQSQISNSRIPDNEKRRLKGKIKEKSKQIETQYETSYAISRQMFEATTIDELNSLEKQALNFDLLSDTQKERINDIYDVQRERIEKLQSNGRQTNKNKYSIG